MHRSVRMGKEIKMMETSPPHGISCWAKDDKLDQLEASIIGGADTPYSNGVFKLSISVPENYPFEPPQINFITPIYHPNIDDAGRICLDALKMPPKGSWRANLNISTLLTSIQVLMANPNPDDPLVAEIAEEYVRTRDLFMEKARKYTEKYAMKTSTSSQ